MFKKLRSCQGYLDIATAVQITKLEEGNLFHICLASLTSEHREAIYPLSIAQSKHTSCSHNLASSLPLPVSLPPSAFLCVAWVIKGTRTGERLLGTQVDGQNDPVCLIREKRYVPTDPGRAGSSWKHSSIVIVDVFFFCGVLVCQSPHLLFIRDILHHEAVTHVRCHFFFSLEQKVLWKKLKGLLAYKGFALMPLFITWQMCTTPCNPHFWLVIFVSVHPCDLGCFLSLHIR